MTICKKPDRCLKTLQVTVLIKMFYIVTWVMDVVLDPKPWCSHFCDIFPFGSNHQRDDLSESWNLPFTFLLRRRLPKTAKTLFGFILEDYICICSKQLVHATKRQPSLKLLNRLYRWHVQELSQSCHVLFSYDDYINNTLCTVEERLFNSLVVFLNVLVWRAWSCMASAVMSHAPSA